eukprot:6193173-Pleurochrysis_carterae.AAC.1
MPRPQQLSPMHLGAACVPQQTGASGPAINDASPPAGFACPLPDCPRHAQHAQHAQAPQNHHALLA